MTELFAHTSRVGFINLNGDFSTLLPAALDEQDQGGLLLRIPYLVDRFPERWFWTDLEAHIGSDGKSMPREYPPAELDYFDNEGTVGLVGCRATGKGAILYGGHAVPSGVGELTANFAVEKATRAFNYSQINGLRSELDGLGSFMSLWAYHTTLTLPNDGSPATARTTMEVPPDVRLGRRLNLCVTVRGTAPMTVGTEARYTSTAMLQTHTKTQRDWMEHLQLHGAIRDLLRLAVWKPVAFRAHEVTSDQEKVQIGDNSEPLSRWCDVKTGVTGIGPAVWGPRERPLFTFADIGQSGVGKWLVFSETYRRGTRPFLRLLDLRDGTVDEGMAQLGIAIEAFGYQAFIDDGMDEKDANRVSVKDRLTRIVDEVSECVRGIPESFVSDFASGYNGVKHANRPDPDPVDLFTSYKVGVRVVRAWIAMRLGVPKEIIYERLR